MQEAVSFPSGIGRASSWDPKLEEQIGQIVGRQERAVGITQTLAPVLSDTSSRVFMFLISNVDT